MTSTIETAIPSGPEARGATRPPSAEESSAREARTLLSSQAGCAAQLQSAVDDLVRLSLIAKHAHWNVKGPHFGVLHEHFDVLASVARNGADAIAERLVTIGHDVDGRPEHLTDRPQLVEMPIGSLSGEVALRFVVTALGAVRENLGAAVSASGDDLVSQSILLDELRQLDTRAWMLLAQQEGSTS